MGDSPAGLRTLVLGGARSGKSAHAEELAGAAARVRYLATAVPDPADRDFAARIAGHRVRRPADWEVLEGADLAAVLAGHPGDPDPALAGHRADLAPATLVDDIGTWLTARIDALDAWDAPRGTVAPETDALVAAVAGYRHRLVLVSPEVGLGVIPATRSGRLFRDEIGTLNQRLARVCDEVVLVVAGIPMRVK
ncbi:bifunctional adenosylcobinamide kinase/adenosylcobinamide-phosphate guanylyltransferase [Nocardia harenae]|uniref:bifunctional adenosylcobinamide kinase/adenosylcobinamide-phosphate guanylyltransferase n=1 Tax=Nocardia harenae TaxID=358707 RepID=UPI00082E7113|nr:bifunctional adenosylcobinamide kinase/adenosylcobinamide-phosphate guanylyltransferase [Nocardia harenae]